METYEDSVELIAPETLVLAVLIYLSLSTLHLLEYHLIVFICKVQSSDTRYDGPKPSDSPLIPSGSPFVQLQ